MWVLTAKFFQLCFMFENIYNKMFRKFNFKKKKEKKTNMVLDDCYFVSTKR